MPTPYSAIYESFLSKISDYSFLSLSNNELEYNFERWLRSAITNFAQARVDLSDRNNSLKQFNQKLSDSEIEILATLMVVEWLSPKVRTSELLKQVMNDRDFKTYSQANHLAELVRLRNGTRDEANSLIRLYTYRDGIGDLR